MRKWGFGLSLLAMMASAYTAWGQLPLNVTGQSAINVTKQSLNVTGQSPLDVTELKLQNGFTVWLNIDRSQPKVFGAVVVKAGAKDCPNTGIAHYFEHLLFKGTQKIGTVDYAAEKPWLDSIAAEYDKLAATTDPQQRRDIQSEINRLSIKAADYAIPNEFERLITTYGGTGLNAYTSFDETVYHNTFSPQYIGQWCELNAERLIDPVFRLFQGELETVYEEKNMYSDHFIARAAEAAQRQALAGTPYAYPIIGSTESLKNPRLSEMMTYYNEHYVAGNMGLMLSGDIPTDSLMPILERTFGRIRQGDAPQTPVSKIRDLRGGKTLKLKVPIPILKALGYAFKAPTEHNADYAAFKVATAMLANNSKTGLLDSLANDNRVMMAGGTGFDFKDFSVYGFGVVPNLPFGSKQKAARECWAQIDKLRQGNFSDEALKAEKLSVRRNMEEELENIRSRSSLMINAFSHNLTWSQILHRSQEVEAVTREDIVRVARTYFNNDSLKVEKAFGTYPKEHLTQPGYKPVQPKNAGQQSAYARQLAKMPYRNRAPKMVDIDRDAHHRQIAPLVNLYTVANPVNDLFSLQLVYRRGTVADPRLEPMADYLNEIGTRSKTKQQLGRALQRIGATIGVSATPSTVVVTLSGFDNQLEPALALLHEFISEPQASEKKFADIVKSVKMEERTFFKDNASIADAVYEMAKMGRQSTYLRRVSAKDLKRMDGEKLLQLFADLQHYQADVVYSGNVDGEAVARLVERYLPLSKVDKPWQPTDQTLNPTAETVVYVFDNPKARQTIVGTYQQMGPMTTLPRRMTFSLWGDYFGGGMSSLMFQDIREFRSLAYSAHGRTLLPNLRLHADKPCGYVTRMGTQADKTMQALATLDSLMNHMPMREANIVSARQEIVNDINNSYPTFRAMGQYVARLRLLGYDADPARDVLKVLPQVTTTEVETFYRDHIQGKPRAIIIVGNKRLLDMEQLKKMGRVVMLSAKDIYNRY